MAAGLDLYLVAEGVKTEAQADRLIDRSRPPPPPRPGERRAALP
jgi:hypothetical protein